jgi:hypothetical protein
VGSYEEIPDEIPNYDEDEFNVSDAEIAELLVLQMVNPSKFVPDARFLRTCRVTATGNTAGFMQVVATGI